MKTIKQIVFEILQHNVETNGKEFILNLGYRECSDYAQLLKEYMQNRDQCYYRFETVARYTREFKENLKAQQ